VFVGSEYVMLRVKIQGIGDSQKTASSVVEQFALQVLHKRLRVQHLGGTVRH